MTGEQEKTKMTVLAIMRPENYRERSEALARDYGFNQVSVEIDGKVPGGKSMLRLMSLLYGESLPASPTTWFLPVQTG